MARGDRSERSDCAAEKAAKGNCEREDAKHDVCSIRSPSNVATPSRAGRSREHTGSDKARGPVSALEDLMRRKGVDEAWCALEEMQRQGITTDKYTVSRMLMKTVGDGRAKLNPPRVYRAISLVERFIDMQPKDVDEVLFNALLDTCCRLKDLSRLEATVNRMTEFKVAPSPVTLGILVKTYGQAGDIQKVLQVWDDMEKQRDQANAVTYGCMIDACVKCGHLEKAVEIFQGMREAGKHKNTILYTTLIKGYGLEKDLPHALELFREMPQEGVPCNTITFNSILDACIKCGDLATAEGLLREMTAPDSSLEPDLITFSTLLKGYCHIGNLEKALQVAEAIKARGLRCDELVYNTLMDGCVKANDITAGVGLFEEMVQSGMRPSTITHSILSKLYQHAGYEDASERVAQLYRHHGIERPNGHDLGKSFCRRFNPRSPGRGERTAVSSPLGSPSAASAASAASAPSLGSFNDVGWGSLGGLPAESASDRSAPSTPMRSLQGSPASSMGAVAAPFLPLESPYSMHPCTPVGPSFPGSMTGSPCGSSQTESQGFHMPASAGCSQVGPFMAGAVPGGAQQLPPWPLACGAPLQSPGMSMGLAPPLPLGSRASGEVCMQQMVTVTMMQAPQASPLPSMPAMPSVPPMPSMHSPMGQPGPVGQHGQPQGYFDGFVPAGQQAGCSLSLVTGPPGNVAGVAGLGGGSSAQGLSLS